MNLYGNNMNRSNEVVSRKSSVERDGFRISELTLAESGIVPWHYHPKTSDLFYVLSGELTIETKCPDEMITLMAGQSFSVVANRPHQVRNSGSGLSNFLILQGIGEYGYIPVGK